MTIVRFQSLIYDILSTYKYNTKINSLTTYSNYLSYLILMKGLELLHKDCSKIFQLTSPSLTQDL